MRHIIGDAPLGRGWTLVRDGGGISEIIPEFRNFFPGNDLNVALPVNRRMPMKGPGQPPHTKHSGWNFLSRTVRELVTGLLHFEQMSPDRDIVSVLLTRKKNQENDKHSQTFTKQCVAKNIVNQVNTSSPRKNT